jgi:hypothetical protein
VFDLHHTTEFVNCIQTRSSPLSLAVEKGYLDIVELLLENKADVNIKDKVAYDLSRLSDCYCYLYHLSASTGDRQYVSR